MISKGFLEKSLPKIQAGFRKKPTKRLFMNLLRKAYQKYRRDLEKSLPKIAIGVF
jgi:hypothetical protein